MQNGQQSVIQNTPNQPNIQYMQLIKQTMLQNVQSMNIQMITTMNASLNPSMNPAMTPAINPATNPGAFGIGPLYCYISRREAIEARLKTARPGSYKLRPI